ncbi:cofG [Symbiodinium sp. CCMP2592]|nr:cofG [Symbiodinium sp. CCMP2592]
MQGKSRFHRLSRAAKEGKHAPPADLRFLCRPFREKDDRGVRSEIVSFLESMYQSVAETLPDVRDDPMEECDDQVKVMVSANNETEDNYAAALNDVKPFKARTTKPRKFKNSIQIVRAETDIRYLPPGNMKDYWLQLNASRADTAKPISFAQFWRVWSGEFSHLKFRQQSNHAQCSECIKHKLLVRELSHHQLARKEQVRRYTEHLRSQYYDRVHYWNLRGASRLRNGGHVSCIIDSMDQSKSSLPRSDLCRAKDLSTLIRPKCHITTVICHGHFVLMVLSNHDMPKNSSVMVEIMAHCLSRLSSTCRLADVSLHVQSDNTVREMKNNPFIKWMAAMTGQGVVREASLQNLRSGHSHEDVDQLFGSCATYLASKGRHAETPEDLLKLLEAFLRNLPRPHEAGRFVVKLDGARDWQLRFYC